MKDVNQMIEEVAKQLEKLPFEAQKAIWWLIKNIEFVEAISLEKKMSEAEIVKFIEDARKSKDYIMLAMVLYNKLSS